MIAIFARSNHPVGWGWPALQPHGPNMGRAHGYVVIGVRCQSQKQLDRVKKHIQVNGCDLPDRGRLIYHKPKEELKPYERTVWGPDMQRWYSGGPNDWDYIFTVKGNQVDGIEGLYGHYGSRGDNRFCQIYEAKEVLND